MSHLTSDCPVHGPDVRWGDDRSFARTRVALAAVARGADWVFGCMTLLVTLAVLAVIPVLNLISLGYLLEASARVARSERLRDGFVGIRGAALFGRAIVAGWLILWPARFALGLSRDAQWISPGSGAVLAWRVVFLGLALLGLAHLVFACARGARARHFLWPAPRRFKAWLAAPDGLAAAGGRLLQQGVAIGLPHYFKLGAMGLLSGLAWLAAPVGVLMLASFLPPAGGALLALLGGAGLVWVTLFLPFLQGRAALENRWAACFELGEAREMFGRAPLAFCVALSILLLFSVPLYLLKIEFPPREIAWLPSLAFVLFMLPARLITGWAIGRARRRQTECHWSSRWLGRMGMVGAATGYVLVVYLTQYLSWHGVLSLIEQHAFLVPAPVLRF